MSRSKEIINELLIEVFNHILNIEEENLRNKGVELSMNEVHILEAIKGSSEPNMGNVARKLRVTTGTLTTSINKLVQKECVTRYFDEEDRRKVYLKLTSYAENILKVHDEFHSEMIENVITDLKLDEDETLIKSLESVSNYFKSQYN